VVVEVLKFFMFLQGGVWGEITKQKDQGEGEERRKKRKVRKGKAGAGDSYL
jgi:hypothetical protein